MLKLVIMILLLSIVSGGGVHGGGRGGGHDSSSHDNNNYDCSQYNGKTYQLVIDYKIFNAYQFLVLHSDKTTTLIDSTESNPDFTGTSIIIQPFTTTLGKWSCCGRNRIRVDAVNYNLQEPGTTLPITISYYHTSLTIYGKSVKGKYNYANYPVGTDPTSSDAVPVPGQTFGPFDVSGEEINLPQRCR